MSSAFVAGCGGNYHKKCAYKIPNNCSDSRHRTSSTIVNSPSNANTLPRPSSQVVDPVLLQQSNSLNDSMPSLKERRATWSGRSVWIEPALSGRIQVPHTFAIHSYKRPTNCQICKRLVSDVSYSFLFKGNVITNLGTGISPGTISMTAAFFHRKQKRNRIKLELPRALFSSPATNCLYPGN